jgi:neuronal PAS domain-containing protein 1/3
MDVFEEHEGTHILQSMDGFAISLASDARFLYISETVSIYLGLSQVSSSTWASHRSVQLRIT